MIDTLTDEQWRQYESQGFLRLGKVLTDKELKGLQHRIDEIMLGKVKLDFNQMLMQLDRKTNENRPELQSKGHKGATLNYRKILHLEKDSLILSFIQNPLFRHVCNRVYGPKTKIACYRAMFFNKPARGGTPLSWHQDRWTWLDRDPLLSIWTALDSSTKENGCLKLVPGVQNDLVLPHFPEYKIPDEKQIRELLPDAEVVNLEVEAGESCLLHTHLPHGSEINNTDSPRRALSFCYMDAATKADNGLTFPIVFDT